MKHITRFLTAALVLSLISTAAFAQNILIANSNPGATGGTNVYTGATALQLAINAATTGDIIHVIPSSISYGNVIITDKSLSLIGIGLNPQKALGVRSIAGTISINGTTSSGSRISGMHFKTLSLAGTPATGYSISNILCENNEFDLCIAPSNTNNSVANLIIRNCVINGGSGTSDPQSIWSFTTSGVIITNNIFKGFCCSSSLIQGNGLTIQNNLFYYNGTGGVWYNLDNSTVQNNIFLYSSGSVGTGGTHTGNTFNNNIAFGSGDNTFPVGSFGNTGSGNITADPMLTNVPSSLADWIYTNDITPLPGSPIINAGLDGTNIGPTGGITPFDVEGTLLPLIQAINMPAVVTKGTDLEVNVKAKGN